MQRLVIEELISWIVSEIDSVRDRLPARCRCRV